MLCVSPRSRRTVQSSPEQLSLREQHLRKDSISLEIKPRPPAKRQSNLCSDITYLVQINKSPMVWRCFPLDSSWFLQNVFELQHLTSQFVFNQNNKIFHCTQWTKILSFVVFYCPFFFFSSSDLLSQFTYPYWSCCFCLLISKYATAYNR